VRRADTELAPQAQETSDCLFDESVPVTGDPALTQSYERLSGSGVAASQDTGGLPSAPDRPPDAHAARLKIAFASSLVSRSDAAATFAVTCSGEPEPGMGNICGDLSSSQASATWRVLT
jgi:hypothetical protein